MATTDQITANRANAQHSTGPTSDAGKQTCSQNSLKHGLASSRILIGGESQEEYDEALAQLMAEHQPVTHTETLCIQDLAKYRWLAQRAINFQNEELMYHYPINNECPKSLGLLIRYQTTNERAAQKDLATFFALRKARLAEAKSEIGSVSKSVPQAAPEPAQEAAASAPQTSTHKPSPPQTVEDIMEIAAKGYFFNFHTGEYEESNEENES